MPGRRAPAPKITSPAATGRANSSMRVIGTAGHVDHGKSSLVEKLSGIHPDRLAEEQSRGLTIDLGFAWLELPNGETVGIVDVPGHRDFIENMLAGVGGIDAALLVIAADEGIMPQTREHLSILRLLDIRKLIVVISKIDLIDDEEWLELVQLEAEDLLAESELAGAPIVPVSAQTGAGIERLLDELSALLAGLPERVDSGQPRLPIDRVFVVSGFGTVVTGTLMGGALSVGDALVAQPGEHSGRVRGLQSYKRDVQTALPGSRVAVNIAGINKSDIKRGAVLARPGRLQPTLLADAHFTMPADSEGILEHNTEVKFFCGAAEALARLRLLDADSLAAGESGWLQIRLREALPLTRGDRFILRVPSPARTIGGGIIVNAQPGKRYKRMQPQILDELDARLHGSLGEQLAIAARAREPKSPTDLAAQLGFSTAEMQVALAEALVADLLRELPGLGIWASDSWRRLVQRMLAELGRYHSANPLRLGMSRAELGSRLRIKLPLLDTVITDETELTIENGFVRAQSHSIRFSHEQEARIDRLMTALEVAPYSPPTISEMNGLAGEAVVRALLDLRRLVQVSDSIAFAAADYARLVAAIRAHIEAHGEIDAKTLRDQFGSSRKYAIPLLERLDAQGITRRVGDARVPGASF
ncbi:MAG: selenocysteine-specific translation elongation factor [Chloroflexi bacterium]|nr:selenocysteine-specific translation elongation factor [Chloroflexota bacterium]